MFTTFSGPAPTLSIYHPDFFRFHSSRSPLAVGRVGRALHNASINETIVAPVVALSTLTVNRVSAIEDRTPERSTLYITAPCIALGVSDTLASFVSVVVKDLKRPFSDENRELAITGSHGCLTTNSAVDVLGVDTRGGEIVDMSVDDQVRSGCEVARPVFLTEEAVLEHNR